MVSEDMADSVVHTYYTYMYNIIIYNFALTQYVCSLCVSSTGGCHAIVSDTGRRLTCLDLGGGSGCFVPVNDVTLCVTYGLCLQLPGVPSAVNYTPMTDDIMMTYNACSW